MVLCRRVGRCGCAASIRPTSCSPFALPVDLCVVPGFHHAPEVGRSEHGLKVGGVTYDQLGKNGSRRASRMPRCNAPSVVRTGQSNAYWQTSEARSASERLGTHGGPGTNTYQHVPVAGAITSAICRRPQHFRLPLDTIRQHGPLHFKPIRQLPHILFHQRLVDRQRLGKLLCHFDDPVRTQPERSLQILHRPLHDLHLHDRLHLLLSPIQLGTIPKRLLHRLCRPRLVHPPLQQHGQARLERGHRRLGNSQVRVGSHRPCPRDSGKGHRARWSTSPLPDRSVRIRPNNNRPAPRSREPHCDHLHTYVIDRSTSEVPILQCDRVAKEKRLVSLDRPQTNSRPARTRQINQSTSHRPPGDAILRIRVVQNDGRGSCEA